MLVTVLAGCGQTGPLYMPQPPAKPAAMTPVPAVPVQPPAGAAPATSPAITTPADRPTPAPAE